MANAIMHREFPDSTSVFSLIIVIASTIKNESVVETGSAAGNFTRDLTYALNISVPANTFWPGFGDAILLMGVQAYYAPPNGIIEVE